MMQEDAKPVLSIWRIILMNVGFFGIQFSFGLQQGNMGPIYSYLGASEAALPLLQLAGPVTGLVLQPIIGAMSDRTISRFGRRVPYFLIGAVLCTIGLFAMPYSPALWVAAVLLWLLDSANNITMEPYRAYVSDRLNPRQRTAGFLTQGAFTGLAQTLAYIAPTALVLLGMHRNALSANGIPAITRAAFVIGAVISITSILCSVLTVPELKSNAADIAAIRAQKPGVRATLAEIISAMRAMPGPMRQMAVMSLFQWYAMMAYWSYVIYSIAQSVYHTAAPASAGFRAAVLTNGQIGAWYNLIAFVAAFLMMPLSRRFGARRLHAVSLTACAISMLTIPLIGDKSMLFIAVMGIGLGWASMMGNPYIMLANCIPPARTGVYMGIFNMFIVVPMLIFGLTMPLIFHPLLGGDPRNVLLLAGALMLLATLATLRIRTTAPTILPLQQSDHHAV
jgi:maltose/moltooligosaccharide transporter